MTNDPTAAATSNPDREPIFTRIDYLAGGATFLLVLLIGILWHLTGAPASNGHLTNGAAVTALAPAAGVLVGGLFGEKRRRRASRKG